MKLMLLLLLATAAAGRAGHPEPITIDPSRVHQTIEGWGGHVYGQGYAFLATDTTLMERMLTDLATTHIRVRSVWYMLEAVNDNDDPSSLDLETIARHDTGLVHQELLFQQELARRGVALQFASWRFPYWMIGRPPDWRPAPEDRPALPPDMDDEYVESILGYLLYARDRYGVVFDAVSVANEPDIGIYIDGLSPARLLALSRALAARLEAHQYPTRFYLPDAAAVDSISHAYVQEFFTQDGAAAFTTALAYHSYRRSPEVVRSYAALAAGHGLPVWVTEQNDTHLAAPDRHEWSHALKNAVCLQELLVAGNASLSLHWAFVMASSGGLGTYRPEQRSWTPTHTMLKHFQNHIPPGSVRIEARPAVSASGVLASAFLLPGGRTISCVLVNPDTASAPVRLMLPSGVAVRRALVSSPDLRYAGGAPDDGVARELPPMSVTTLEMTRE